MSIESIHAIESRKGVKIDKIDITSSIVSSYDLLTYSMPGRLRFNDVGIMQYHTEHPIITTNHVSILDHDEETGVKWEFNVEDIQVGIEAGSVQSASREIEFRNKYKIRHNFVSEAINKSATDVKLRDIFDEEGDEDDELTPDFIWMDSNGFYHAIEVSTTRNNTEEGLIRAYDIKAFKYKYALETRAMKNKVVTYTIIIVSQDYVYSSIRLSRIIVSELIVRMRIGIALENSAKAAGLKLESTEADTIKELYIDEIKSHLEKIQFRMVTNNELNIDKNYIKAILKDPNHKKVLEFYLNDITKTKQEALDLKASMKEPYIIVENYVNQLKRIDMKKSLKPVINLPLFLANSTESNVNIADMFLDAQYDSVESKIWQIAMDDYRSERVRNIDEDPAALMNEALETDYEAIKIYESKRKSQRSKYHRVDIASSLSYDDKIKLAEQGLWAKKFTNDEFYKERRKESQKAFHWDTDTNDISDFINSTNIYDSLDTLHVPNEFLSNLLSKSNELIGNNSDGLDVIKTWMNTKLFRSLDLISDIALELCISNKQNCKSGTAILKKIRYYEVYLLIFPTKSNEHMFFTLYFPSGEVLFNLPFRKLIKTNNGYISTLVSVKQSKLENWCNASSSLISLISFWSWFYEMNDENPESFKSNKEASKMLLLSILIRLEDKSQTEESITQMRYMYMESFKGLITPMISNPLKILSKLTTNPRSRLNLWVLRQCTSNFLTMSLNPPSKILLSDENLIEGEDSLPKDTWRNLLNCFTGTSIMSASKVINLVYLGYLKNKNESPEGNTDFSLIEKTLEEEFKYNKINCELSKGELTSTDGKNGKQFNKECIMFGCEVMEKKLEKTLGSDWKILIGNKIIENLSRNMTETLASLKATSTINHGNCPKETSYLEPKSAMRIKVIEAISLKLNDLTLNPFTRLNNIISYIENTSKGVIADLFKKQQHGGLREIYVLTIESRIVQLFIEVISRTICSYFDEETLTHPKNKLKKLNEHRRLSARLANKRVSLSVDLCCSNDKTRWNQNFVMPAMSIPLLRMTPTFMHNSILRILNLWSNKLIKIPQSVCISMLNRVKYNSEIYNKMISEFWNYDSNNTLFDFPNSDCLRLKTGMMQGILHYTSSLLHLSFLHASNKMITSVLNNWFPDYKFLMTQICSSDDSATMLSILAPVNHSKLDNNFLKAACYSSLCLESLSSTCKLFCMLESVKSAISVNDYVEFNSEFMFQNTIAMPVIKFVAASQNMTESESFLDRFYTQYNLISDLYASGMTSEHTHLCQIAQAMFHYKTMGLGTNALFEEWMELILIWPDPKYGFFLLDEKLCPGVLGYSYAHWNVSVKTSIFQGTIRELNMEPWITTPEGGVTQTLIMKHGEVKRWTRMVKSIVGDMNLQDEIEKDPSILFRPVINMKELKVKLSIKATSPGVAKSMRRGNPFMQAVAMSVYAINTHSFSKTTVTQDVTRVKSTQKVSIIGELYKMVEKQQTQELKSNRDFSQSLIVAFPNKYRYEECSKLFNQLRHCIKVPCHRFRERKNEIVIQPRSAALPLTLIQVLGLRWFGIPIRASHKIYSRCYAVYLSTIPWIRETIKTCLEASPFNTYQELYNFISSNPEKCRVFRRNGPGLYSKRLSGQMYNLIRKSQRPCTILIEKEKRKLTFPSRDMITKLNLALSIPEPMTREYYTKKILESHDKIYDDLTSISLMIRREATLAYIQGIIKNDFTLEEVAIHMRDLGLGTHISYVKEQKKLIREDGSIRWVGKGICYVFIEGCQISMEFKDDVLLIIRVDDWKKLRSNIYTLNQLIREMGLKPCPDSSRPHTVIAKYNGTHIVSRDAVGTPVVRLKEQDKIIFDPKYLMIKIDQNEIKIIQRVRSTDKLRIIREVCMLKYKLHHNDIILTSPGPPIKDLWKSWINQSPCHLDTMLGVIKHYQKDKRTKIYSWLQETLQSRLQFKNMGTFNVRYYDAALEHEDPQVLSSGDYQEDEEMLQMIRGKIFDIQEFSEMQPFKFEKDITKIQEWSELAESEILEEELKAIQALGALGIEEPFPLWVDYVKNWAEYIGEESVSIIGPTVGSFMSIHPIWDEVIDGLYRERQSFWHELMDGSISPGFEDIALALMHILDISPKKIGAKVTGISDRFKQAELIRAEVYALSRGLEEPQILTPISPDDTVETLSLYDETQFTTVEEEGALGPADVYF